MPLDEKITREFIEKTVATGKQYCLAFWKAGPDRSQPADEANRIQMEHLVFLFKLRAEGKLLINGPVIEDPDYKGMAIFNMTDPIEVKTLLEADPTVITGRDVIEVYHWFGIPGDVLR
jgi:uncharacterized protein